MGWRSKIPFQQAQPDAEDRKVLFSIMQAFSPEEGFQ